MNVELIVCASILSKVIDAQILPVLVPLQCFQFVVLYVLSSFYLFVYVLVIGFV